MRCYCCNTGLNDYESTLKSATTGEYLDMCLGCLTDLGIQTEGRADLNPYESPDGEFDLEEDEDD